MKSEMFRMTIIFTLSIFSGSLKKWMKKERQARTERALGMAIVRTTFVEERESILVYRAQTFIIFNRQALSYGIETLSMSLAFKIPRTRNKPGIIVESVYHVIESLNNYS